MRTSELLNFYKIQHEIFGICPNSKQFFRLSSCRIYTTKKPEHDWLKIIEDKQNKIELLVKRFHEQESERLNIEGKRQADKIIRKIDKIFRPKKLNPNDSFGIFNPIDFVVFDGMDKGKVKRVLLLDSYKKSTERDLQDSIKNVVKQKKYKFQTLRIDDNGRVTEE